MAWEKIGGIQNDGLYRHSGNQKIKFKKFRTGKGEIDRSCKTTSLERARSVRDELMAELWDERPLKAKRQIIGEIWPSWQQGMIVTCSKGTASSIASSRKHLEPYIFNMFLDDITNEWWTTVYIPKKREEIDRDGESREKRKFFNDRKWLGMFLKWADENGKAPAGWRKPRLTDPDPERDAGKCYTYTETDALIQHADWLLLPKIIMGLEHFMRRSEVALMEKAWIDRKNRIINLPAYATKIRKARSFPYNDRLEQLFCELDEKLAHLGSPFVFPSPKDPTKSIGRDGFATAWSSCKRKADVVGRFHDLRGTGLTRAFKAPGGNPALICHFAGLSLDEAMKTYIRFSIEDMRGVANLVPGSRSEEILVFGE